MTRQIALVLGAGLLALGMFLPAASAQTVVSYTPADQSQDPQAPSTNTTAKERTQKTMPRAAAEEWAHSGPNVRVEVTLTDQKSGAPTTSKTVMVTTSNENWGRLRSEVTSAVYGSAPLNVDARPIVLQDGRISLQLSVEYSQGRRPDAEGNTDMIREVRINESLTAVLESAKPLLITQSADPTSDRKVTVEVKATVLR